MIEASAVAVKLAIIPPRTPSFACRVPCKSNEAADNPETTELKYMSPGMYLIKKFKR